jgi:uncharacterized membrane protein YoaK (UPF0700 family)
MDRAKGNFGTLNELVVVELSMPRDDLGHLSLAICMMAVAGYVDAVGFLALGHLFVSYMSGNSTQFAVSLVDGNVMKAGKAGGIVALYVFGVVIGHLLALRVRIWRRPAVLLLEAALLGIALLAAPSRLAIVPTVLAMGVQNEALHRAGEIKTQLTYVTGALVSLGEHIASALSGHEPDKRWAWVPYLLLWGGLIVGAFVGALVYAHRQIGALVWPALAVLLFAAITAATAWHGRMQQGSKPEEV